jgi:CheY-like chemotaxis protein
MAKILLVEDDNNLREIFELRLQADGYQTLVAGDGEAALVTAMKEKPDLIICDVMMPKMSGFEMLETLRNAPEMASTKVIMMTALGQAEDQARGAKLGVVKYLVKSQVTLEDFARVVREVLGPAAGTNAAPAAPAPVAANEVSQVNNKLESEKPMDPSSTSPMPPADPAAGGDPQSSADEQSTVDSQVNSFAAGAPAAPTAPASPVDPLAPASDASGLPATAEPAEHADVPLSPPPADPVPPAEPAAPTVPPVDPPTVPPAV